MTEKNPQEEKQKKGKKNNKKSVTKQFSECIEGWERKENVKGKLRKSPQDKFFFFFIFTVNFPHLLAVNNGFLSHFLLFIFIVPTFLLKCW